MQLARREKIATLILAVFLVVFGMTEWVLLPTLGRLKSLDGLIERKEKELAEMRALQAEYLQMVEQSANVEKAIKQRGRGFTLFSFLESLAQQTEVKKNIKYMKPSTTQLNEQYNESSVEIKLEKINLEQLIRYIYRVEYAGRLLQIKRMHVRPQYKNPSLLDVTLLVYTQEIK
ncbi:MAG: type II secretion system protein M [Deltaproteobacteria bacterium]|nr:type II secretion system protein M [Deltaproteobacteria bacterium]MBW2305595.1 type II secretion system protein M [Deltaproteobacteria bacterium]